MLSLSESAGGGPEGVVGLSVLSVGASLWLEPGRRGRVGVSRPTPRVEGGAISLKLGPATLLRFEMIELDRLSPCGI